MKNFIRTFINIVLILIIIYCGYNIFIKLKDYKEADKVYSEIQTVYKSNNKENNDTYESLYKINSDYKFWISVDNTNINYPVLQGKDNSFYLNKDIYKNSLASGSIFMDYRNNPTSDKNIILYGHNMKNKTMFNALEQFKQEDFFNSNNKIKIEDKDNEYIYEVFSAYFVDASYDYLINNFDSDEDYNFYLNNIKDKSLYKSNVNVSAQDKIITLSTCSYETNNTRTVVHGKLISKKTITSN